MVYKHYGYGSNKWVYKHGPYGCYSPCCFCEDGSYGYGKKSALDESKIKMVLDI